MGEEYTGMDDLSLHILDIVENSIEAGATFVEIEVEKNLEENRLRIRVKDNGKGVLDADIERLKDPFFTTKGKKTGLGIPLFCQTAQETGGGAKIVSNTGRGTEIDATFRLNHIDLKPMGDVTATLTALIGGHPDIDFIFKYKKNSSVYIFDTREIKVQLGEIPISYPGVINRLRDMIREAIDEVEKGRSSG